MTRKGHSHALLGIFDAIAPAASAALGALAKGDMKTYDKLMAPTVPLSRLIFRAPTQYYKTGIVFLAWLNGHQDHFVMVSGAQAMRPLPYFTEIFKLADQAGLLSDPELAVKRMKKLLAVYGALMRDLATASVCAINTATLGFQAPIGEVIDAVAAAGFGAIAPWRREVEGHDVSAIARRIRDAGLEVTGYCRSTYIPAADSAGFAANIEANRRAINDAAMLGAKSFVMVVGGLARRLEGHCRGARPGGGGHGAAAGARQGARRAHRARTAASRLCGGPLLPVAALRGAGHVRCDRGRAADPWLGVCLDVYHVWWDPNLARDIARAGAARRIFGFHVCDWLVPTEDVLNDRGMMGDGVIDILAFAAWWKAQAMRASSRSRSSRPRNWWKRPMAETLAVCRERFAAAT